jgi:hypothetical protein
MMRAAPTEPRLEIDNRVLRAFLAVDECIHEARSMQAIVKMSTLSGKPHLERRACRRVDG